MIVESLAILVVISVIMTSFSGNVEFPLLSLFEICNHLAEELLLLRKNFNHVFN